VLLLGDSRIAEWPGLPANYFTINAGVAGETTAQILLRAPAILAAEKPDVVIIQAGINDLKAIGVAPGDSQKIESDCVNNLSQLTELADRHAKKVILTLILPAGKIPLTRRLFWSGEINRAVADANRQIMITFSHAPTVTVLDLEKILVAEPGIKSLDANYRDALHLTPQAYDKLQSAVVLLVGSSPPK
jgi:lysophospholipase L1-like esterase